MLKIFLKVLLFFAGLILMVWVFMPWRQIGEAALLSALDNIPASVSYSTVGRARNGFVVNNLEIRNLMGMVDIYFRTLTIVPDIPASILGMAPLSHVSFTGAEIGDIAITPRRNITGISPGSGHVTVSLNRQGIFLDGLRSDGDLAASGSLLINPSEMRIIWANAAMGIRHEPFEENLSIIASVLDMPLQREGPGLWSLHRARTQ